MVRNTNAQAVMENKKEIEKMKKEKVSLKKDNGSLREMYKDNARYKRRWDIRLLGLPEKDNEDVKETVIGILTLVVQVAVDKLQEMVDTVHRLGKKTDSAQNKMLRPIMIQFATPTAKWKPMEGRINAIIDSIRVEP